MSSMRGLKVLLSLLGLLLAVEAASFNNNINNILPNQPLQQHQQQQQFGQSFYQPHQQQHQQQQHQQQHHQSSSSSISGNAISSSSSSSSGNTFGGFISTTSRPQPFHQTQQHQHQQQQPQTNVVERFHHRFPDGSYEFRYELGDGTARYERGYFLLFDKVKTLVVVGYYSYRMPDGRYITVFYNADQNGYRQNQSITPQTYPNLPRTIHVPEYKDELGIASATTPYPGRPVSSTTRRPQF